MDLKLAAQILYGWDEKKVNEVLKERTCFYCGETLGPMLDEVCGDCQQEGYRETVDRREEMDRIFHPEDYQ